MLEATEGNDLLEATERYNLSETTEESVEGGESLFEEEGDETSLSGTSARSSFTEEDVTDIIRAAAF